MRLSKLTGFLSGLGATVVVGIGSIIPVTVSAELQVTEHEVSPRDHTQSTEVPNFQGLGQSQRNSLESVPASNGNENLTDTTKEHLETQREDLAANPLCSLASDVVEDLSEVQSPNGSGTTKTGTTFLTLVANFFNKFMQMVGLDRLVKTQPISTTKIAVVTKAAANSMVAAPNGEVGQQAPNNAQQNTQLVSHTTPAQPKSLVAEHELWVKGHLIAKLNDQKKATLLAQRLERLVDTASFNAAAIAPTLYQEKPAIAMGDQVLFVIDSSITSEDVKNYEILAIRWANNLRLAFGVPALDLITAQTKMYGVEETNQSIEGLASWYGPYFHGRLTANGETYDQYAFTAAHPSMPLDTYLKITNLNNEKSVIIRLNDRGPYIQPRSLDLSLGAARCLNSVDTGVIPYKATIMKRHPAIAAGAAI
jgi:rare lipoprotein A